MPPATGCGRSTCGAAAGWARSEVFGPAMVRRDEAARLFLYRGDLYREWLAYGSDAKRIAEAFVAGINAYVKLIEQKPELLPVEFRMLHYKPSLWRPEDVVRIRSHGRWRNAGSEVRRAQVACKAGVAGGSDAAMAGAGARDQGAGRPGRVRHPRGSPVAVQPGDGRGDVLEGRAQGGANRRARSVRGGYPGAGGAARCRCERREQERRQQQLGDCRQAHGDRQAAPGQRSAPRAFAALAALHRAPERAGAERDRRGRARPARHFDRPQRADRVWTHDFLHRPGRPVLSRTSIRPIRAK